MQLNQVLTPECTYYGAPGISKKRALQQAANLLHQSYPTISDQDIFTSLIARERLGSTGIGYGVAIPHGRIKGADSAIAALIQLDQGIDFDAIDDQPVDLIFALLVPEESTSEHLDILASLAERLSSDEYRQALRESQDHQSLFEHATQGLD